MNNKLIAHNLGEASEQLVKLWHRAQSGGLNEAEFQVGLLHAYHHLNFAWNIRHKPTSAYVTLTDKQFKRWGKYPSAIEKL